MKTIHTGWGRAIYSKNYKKLMNFVKTNKGKEFVSKLHTQRLEELSARFNCPFVMFFKNNDKNYKLIQKACDDNGVVVVKTQVYPAIKPNIVDYTHVKIPKSLTREEIKAIDLKRTKYKLERDERFHMLENHKMDKWETKHPRPSEEQRKNDLFPHTLYEGWKSLREAHQEAVRNQIVLKYYKDYVPVYGRINRFPFGYAEKIIGFVKDTNNEVNKINDFVGNIEKAPKQIVKKAYCILAEAMKQNHKITSGRILSRDGKHGRILVASPPQQYAANALVTQTCNLYIAA